MKPTLARAGGVAFLLLAAVEAVLYLRGLPGIRDLPGWFFQPSVLPHGPAFAVLIAACLPSSCQWALTQSEHGHHARALLALIGFGAAAQIALHFIVPSGIEHIFQRLEVGHGEFLRIAVARRGQFWETLRNYDDLFAAQQLGVFAGSKPPGTLAVYMLLDLCSQWRPVQVVLAPLIELARGSSFVAPVAELAALVVVVFPLLTFLTIVPVVRTGERLFGDIRAGYAAALGFMTSPAVLLVDLHLDGALFPLLTMTSIALALRGARSSRRLASVASGVTAMFGVYCSFGLVPAVGLACGVSLLGAVREPLERSSPRASEIIAALFASRGKRLLPAALVLLGAVGCLGILVLLLNFQPLRRFEDALAFHAAWKNAVPTALWRKLSLLEFGLYAGLPLMGAFAFQTVQSVVDLVRRKRLTPSLWTLGILVLLLMLAAQQGTNEVARLWLFMIPLLALATGVGLRVRGQEPERDRSWLMLAAAQAALATLMRVAQPW